MLKEAITSFRHNIVQKTANPFFGTLIIVWIIRNWLLLYNLFNFDQGTPLAYKIYFIRDYFVRNSFYTNLLICVVISILALIGSYTMINFSRLIINFFEKIITPLVYKITDKSTVVLKSDFEFLVSENRSIEKKLELERESRLKIQSEYDALETKYNSLLLKQNEEINHRDKIVTNDKKLEILLKNLEKEKRLQSFVDFSKEIMNGQTLDSSDEAIKQFTGLGLAEKGQWSSGNYYRYKLTDIGKELYDQILYKTL